MSQRNLFELSHWSTLVDYMEASPQEFYRYVEHAIKKREIPDLILERVYWQEGGLLSADREYLRVRRGRYFYDICAAPFGTGFFFSSWMVEKIPSPVWAVLALLFLPFILLWTLILSVVIVGQFGIILWLGGIVVGIVVCAVILSQGESIIADHVFVVPYIGSFLERICRPNTYFRRDTESMFHAMAHKAVLEAVDATIKEKGARELTSDQRKPVLREFFRR